MVASAREKAIRKTGRVHFENAAHHPRVSAERFAEIRALLNHDRGITGELMGDPLPGRSALDRRNDSR